MLFCVFDLVGLLYRRREPTLGQPDMCGSTGAPGCRSLEHGP